MASLPQARARNAGALPAAGTLGRAREHGRRGGGLLGWLWRLGRLLAVALLLLAVAAVGLVQVLQTTRLAAVGYEVRALERERMTLAAEVRLLEAEVAQSTRIDVVRAQATERLGMVPPEESMRVAVSVPAPAVAPLPERYAATRDVTAQPEPTWLDVLLARVPGFD